MSCCGQARSQAGIQVSTHDASSAPRTVVFEYVGRTGVNVLGRVSGIQYRFNGPGARLTVDARDRTSLDVLPMLKQVG
jgi:hypothetical protein